MLFASDHRASLDRLAGRIQDAAAVDAELFCDVVTNGSERLLLLVKTGKAAGLKRWSEARAWTDAALALVELELPRWKIRRLICDDGRWYCRISAQPSMPDGLDDVAEVSHEVLANSILGAIVEVRRQLATSDSADSTATVRGDIDRGVSFDALRVCCDNFA